MAPRETCESAAVAEGRVEIAEVDRSQTYYTSGRSWVWLLLVLAAALALRLLNLAQLPLWVDEAESSINAFSILESGVPTGTYLGMPVYENTLVLPWNESAEYEFKDSSYSDRGLALYHGWLPLYAIAASFRLFGIDPPRTNATTPRFSLEQRRRMTAAARLPGVLFGLLSIVGLYLAALRLHSRNAARAASLIGALLAVHISFSQQARYYGATLATCAFAAWSLERMYTRGGWRDYLAGSIVFTLLFYTHLLSFAVVYAVWAISQVYAGIDSRFEPELMRDRSVKCLLLCALLAALCAPWIVATGLLRHFSAIPAAWRLMHFPRDLVIVRAFASEFGVLVVGALVVLALGALFPRSRPVRKVFCSFREHSASLALLYLWLGIGYIAFLFGMPAASLFLARFAMMLLIPVVLLISMIVCSFAEIAKPNRPEYAVIAGALAFIAVSNLVHPLPSATKVTRENEDLESAIRYLHDANLSSSSLIFATPNDHLVLAFYTGMKIQSIAPVRKRFLDNYPGPVLLLEKDNMRLPSFVLVPRLTKAAKASRYPLSKDQARSLSCEIGAQEIRSNLSAQVAAVEPPAARIPSWAMGVVGKYREAEREEVQVVNWRARSGPPFFENTYITSQFDWWNEFFYAFSGATWRKLHPNFEDRIRNATASILGCSDWVAVNSPASATAEDHR